MTNVTVEKGIPLPPAAGDAVPQMEVGESLVWPNSHEVAVGEAVNEMFKRGWSLKSAVAPGGVRIWRVA